MHNASHTHGDSDCHYSYNYRNCADFGLKEERGTILGAAGKEILFNAGDSWDQDGDVMAIGDTGVRVRFVGAQAQHRKTPIIATRAANGYFLRPLNMLPFLYFYGPVDFNGFGSAFYLLRFKRFHVNEIRDPFIDIAADNYLAGRRDFADAGGESRGEAGESTVVIQDNDVIIPSGDRACESRGVGAGNRYPVREIPLRG